MIATTEFLPRLLPYTPSCPSPMAEQALVDAAIAFCEDSLVLRQRLDVQTTAKGQAELDVSVPAQQMPTRILKVWVDGVPIQAVTSDMVDDQRLNLLARPDRFYTLQDDAALLVQLYPVPDGPYAVLVEVALRPTRSAKLLHNSLFDSWLEPVVQGAAARLMAIPDQPFTNLAMSQVCAAKAAYLSRKARIEGAYGRVRGTVAVRARPLA